ncbi:MAG: hypothetical protein R3F11_07900 [Verrucomicrobiales bacterium]
MRNAGGAEYPIIDYIPRFVHADNYANSFGFQWNLHSRTQHDTDTGIAASERRFFEETKWGRDLAGQTILEAAAVRGASLTTPPRPGRPWFPSTTRTLSKRTIISMGRARRTCSSSRRISTLMPFAAGAFDKVYCLGVLQHTPDLEKSFRP